VAAGRSSGINIPRGFLEYVEREAPLEKRPLTEVV